MRLSPRPINLWRRLALRREVWRLEGALKALERERGTLPEEGANLVAAVLRRDLHELKGRLSAEPGRAPPYGARGRFEDACCS
ncbi:hypothetical protein [Truepera radiovictrix]|uniref:Uncharacterized protein n=1 Tax=Truepera radiovictrix (strain DSM 17093 / CIP 108686 / LMG 22925 / RQ-24) TaxID=649638 RepID=D7CYA4_TRURR|nr:hypothetical protein [Truepera radiovictrix]ADI14743.1 hypothetical protein Trad_1624 [Truepera radiovictrix DSM 17093]WMT56707.1 hypothetical protein RCV51_11905 [Truepera radiovictrix]